MSETKKVAILVETSTSYGRTLIRGVVQYANIASSWIFYNEPRGLMDKLPELRKWGLDGIIMRDTPENMPLLDMKIPTVVSIRYQKRVDGVPNIISNCQRIGDTAAEYLRSKGYKQFAFCGFDEMPWSVEREQAFENALPKHSQISVYRRKKLNSDYNQELSDIADWLKSLPKPVGLLSCNDVRGSHVMQACKLAEVRVPQEISILGVNNDDMICEMTSPPLSSISLDITRAGYEAAKCLDRMMKKKTDQPKDIIVEPIEVITRESTDILAIEDAEIAAALHYISKNSKRIVQVNEIAEHIGLNRRSLERRFKQVLGKTIHQEIKRIRIEIMSRMLKETDIPISEIAYDMGFDDINHISRYFSSQKGVSPLQYRKTNGTSFTHKNPIHRL